MAKSNVLVAIFLVSVAAVTAVIVQRDPFVRLIPADVLRGKLISLYNVLEYITNTPHGIYLVIFVASIFSDYRSGCFASTQCKVFKPNDTWPLSPFCGRSRCVALKVSKY